MEDKWESRLASSASRVILGFDGGSFEGLSVDICFGGRFDVAGSTAAVGRTALVLLRHASSVEEVKGVGDGLSDGGAQSDQDDGMHSGQVRRKRDGEGSRGKVKRKEGKSLNCGSNSKFWLTEFLMLWLIIRKASFTLPAGCRCVSVSNANVSASYA